MKNCRGFLLNLCLRLAGLLLSLARILSGPSVVPAAREVFVHPAVALLLMAAIALPSQPCAKDQRSPEALSDLAVGNSSKDTPFSVFPADLTSSYAAAVIEISPTQI